MSSSFQPKTLKDCIRVIATLREEIHKLNVRVKEAEVKIVALEREAGQADDFNTPASHDDIPF